MTQAKLWIGLVALAGVCGAAIAAQPTRTAAKEGNSQMSAMQDQINSLQGRLNGGAVLDRGAVVAFNLTACPKGWHRFEIASGRTIIGTGNGPGLTPRGLLDSGGEERHTLSIAEMPGHNHDGIVGLGGYSFEHHQYNGRMPGEAWQRGTGTTGGNQPHNTMQPFVALLFCEKE